MVPLWPGGDGYATDSDDKTTENATLVSMLLADLVDRGLDPEQAILFVIDGGKALGAGSTTCSASTRWSIAVTGTKRETSPTCSQSGTADDPRPDPRSVALTNQLLAEERLELRASELDRTWPDAAASLREGCTTR